MSQISQATITTPATDPRHIVRLGQVDPASSTSITLPRSPGASVAFTVPVNLAAGLCGVGVKLRAFSESTPAKWLEGTVASYSATTLTLTVTASNGSGAVTDWKLAPSTLSAELAVASDAAADAQAAADAAQAAADAAQAAADAAQATADAAQATADAALPASAQAADVNPAGEDIAAALGGKLNTSALDTDATMAADSDAKVPSQKATRAYVASVLAGVSKNKGPLDCSANPNYPVALNGDSYRCSVAGKIGGASGIVVEVADLIMCVADNAGGTQASVGTSWIVGQANIAGITAAGLAMMQAADEEGQAGLLDAFLLSLSGGTMFENAIVNLFNGSKFQQSTPDKGIAGTAGFSIICSAGYEYKFALGFLFILSDGSTTVRKVLYAPVAPTATDDTTLGYTTDTTWEMADGTQYRCTDATASAAVWEVVPAFDPAAPGPIGDTTPDVVNTTGLNVKGSGGTTTASINGADGSASFASGEVTIDGDGISMGSNNIDFSGTSATIRGGGGYIYLGNFCQVDDYGYLKTQGNVSSEALFTPSSGSPQISIGNNAGTAAWINSDGSASFASGNASIDSDGSASFANGGLMIDEWGNITSNSGASVEVGYLTAFARVEVGYYGSAGTLNVKDSSNTTTASISGADGSASFASGVITLGTNTGTAAWIHSDGSASFGSGAVTIHPSGGIYADTFIAYSQLFAPLVAIGDVGTAGTLNVRDSSGTTTASINGSDGSASFGSGAAIIDSAGTLTLAGTLIGGTQALVTSGGAGAVNLTTLTTEVETTGTLDALTLANGTVGQPKIVAHTAGAFTCVLTPTTAVGFTSITFLASLGQTCTLEYTTAGWVILAVGGLTPPVVA